MSRKLTLPQDEQEARLRKELMERFEACSTAESILGNPPILLFVEEQVSRQKVIHEAQMAFERALEEWRAYRKAQRDAKEG